MWHDAFEREKGKLTGCDFLGPRVRCRLAIHPGLLGLVRSLC